jgi:hypothetical protein
MAQERITVDPNLSPELECGVGAGHLPGCVTN